MKKSLTCDIKGRIYMSYNPRHRCPEGRATQWGSHPAAQTRPTARGRRTPCPGLVHLQAPGLSLSRAGAATQTPDSGRRGQSFFYRQAFAPFGGKTPEVRCLDRIDIERDRQPSVAGGTASRGRPWLTAPQVGNERYDWSINLIDCGWRSWLRRMKGSCPTSLGPQPRLLPNRREATRRL
jgi:hypothetical protein